jgi:hypothetical protein
MRDIQLILPIIANYIKLKDGKLKQRLDSYSHIISATTYWFENAKIRNKDSSYQFNLFDRFKITEPVHSALVADLLNPSSSHGQGNLFLYSFLHKLGIGTPEIGTWHITAEKDRIDILLRRNHPHSVVVIENKSNYADDQKNQMYRYWDRCIHKPLTKGDADPDYTKISYAHYRLIYLTPKGIKKMEYHSALRPDKGCKNVYEQVPMRIDNHSFDKLVVNWLEDCLIIIKPENTRLREYITQYIEYWQ